VRVEVISRLRGRRVAAAPLRRFLERLARERPAAGKTELTVLLAGDATVRRLNRTFRGKDRTTDVLSFPSGSGRRPDGIAPLGEIAISVPQAARQARRTGHALGREIRVLALHGYLHLLGYDHEVDDGSMMRLQSRLARKLLP
jgi:probable rRNA maturation factor